MSDWRHDGDAYFSGLASQTWQRDSFSLGKKQSSYITELCTYEVNNTASKMKLVRHSPVNFTGFLSLLPSLKEGWAGWIKEGNVLLWTLQASYFLSYQYSIVFRVSLGIVLSEWYQNLVPISKEIKGSLKSDSYCSFIYNGVLDCTARTSWV